MFKNSINYNVFRIRICPKGRCKNLKFYKSNKINKFNLHSYKYDPHRGEGCKYCNIKSMEKYIYLSKFI